MKEALWSGEERRRGRGGEEKKEEEEKECFRDSEDCSLRAKSNKFQCG